MAPAIRGDFIAMPYAPKIVKASSDLRRIRALPRRAPLTATAAEQLVRKWTKALARSTSARLKWAQAWALEEWSQSETGGVGFLPVGTGKAQPANEPVLTPGGWRKIGSLRVGDLVIGSGGTPVAVTGVFPQGVRDIARLEFTDGSWARSDYDHLWTFRNAASDNQIQTRTLKEWISFGLDRPCGEHRAHKLFAIQVEPIQRPRADLPLDPYTLGALLGDGGMTQKTVNFTSMDPDIVGWLVLPDGVRPRETASQNSGRAVQYNLTRGRGAIGKTPNPLRAILRDLRLHGLGSHDKFIPAIYLSASIDQRLRLLQGLLDTDGTCALPGGWIEYSTASGRLAEGVRDLVEGLGGTCRFGAPSTNGNFRLGIKVPRALSPFRCARKATPYSTQRPQRGAYRALDRVLSAGRADCVCISVDAPDQLYVTRHHLLTHNTLLLETLPVACAMADGEPSRSVLIIPAALEQKTYSDRRELRKEWRLATPPPKVITRETFHRGENLRLLERLQPRLIEIDEGDEGANFDASVPQRIHRYVVAQRAAGIRVRVVVVTGTPGRRSIMNYWHFLFWGLGEEGMPVPKSRADAELWALALDDGNARQGWRPKPGALGETLDEARAWYAHRLRETPGVIIVDEDSADKVPLTVTLKRAPDCPEIEAAFDRLAHDEESPAGMPVTDPLSLLRIKGQLGCGFYTYYDPPPPEEWAQARRDSAKLVRARISQTRHSANPLDTEGEVIREQRNHPIIAAWLEIKDTYVPADHAQTEWLSDATLKWARAWLAAADEPSILWCGWTEFGERLRALTKLPYFGPKGKEVRTGRELHNADAAGRDRVIISSWHANKRGFNLQAWRRHAIVQPPQSAKFLEQLFGRPHRQGQTQPVRFEILVTSGATVDSFQAALSEARFVQQTASTTQKLLRAKIVMPRGDRDGFRWIEASAEE